MNNSITQSPGKLLMPVVAVGSGCGNPQRNDCRFIVTKENRVNREGRETKRKAGRELPRKCRGADKSLPRAVWERTPPACLYVSTVCFIEFDFSISPLLFSAFLSLKIFLYSAQKVYFSPRLSFPSSPSPLLFRDLSSEQSL